MPRVLRFCRLAPLLTVVLGAAQAQDQRLVPVAVPSVDTVLVDRVMASGSPRVLVLGDSYAMTLWSRVLPVYTGLWDYGEIAAFTGTGSPGNRIADFGVIASPYRQVEAGADGYGVYPGTPASGFFALPIRGMSEFRVDATLNTVLDRLGKLRVRNDLTEDATGRPLLPAGSRYALRLLYHSPADPAAQHGEIELIDQAGGVTPIDLRTAARGKRVLGQTPGVPTTPTPGHINAAATEPIYTLDPLVTVPQPTTFVNLPAGAPPTDHYATIAGAVYRRVEQAGDNLPGVYYSVLADNSWSYVGFGNDRPSAGPTDKTFSAEQFAHWLDATTIDPAQPVVAMYYLAAELQTRATAEQRIEAMIVQTNAAAALADLPAPVHLLILPHYHQIAQRTDAEIRQRFEWQRDAMFAIARRRADTAAASIYDATNGILFEGSSDAVTWLAANGYDEYLFGGATYDLTNGDAAGVLLDGNTLHPRDTAAAVCFADVLSRMITSDRGCSPADVADPSGVLDIDDLLVFLDAFNTGATTADLAAPWATLDIDDVLTFLDRFAAGCE